MQLKLMMSSVLFATLAFNGCHNSHPSSLEIRHFVLPEYPALAQLARLEDDVKATIGIRVDGTVQSLEVTSDYALLRKPVETAIKQWTFQPLPAAKTAEVIIKFRMDCTTPVSGDLPKIIKISACPHVMATDAS